MMLFGYPVLMEAFAGGQTLGKRPLGIAVVGDDGTPVTFVAATIRNVVRLIDLLPGAYTVGLIAVLATKRSQRLGDLAAGTLVIHRTRLQSVVGGPVPYSAGWNGSTTRAAGSWNGGPTRPAPSSTGGHATQPSVGWTGSPMLANAEWEGARTQAPFGRGGEAVEPPFGRDTSAPPPAEIAAWDTSALSLDEVAAVRAFLGRRQSLDPQHRSQIADALASQLLPKVAGIPLDGGPELLLERIAYARTFR